MKWLRVFLLLLGAVLAGCSWYVWFHPRCCVETEIDPNISGEIRQIPDAAAAPVLASAASDIPTKEQIEADLRLRVEMQSPKILQAGSRPWLAVALVNSSKAVTHRV